MTNQNVDVNKKVDYVINIGFTPEQAERVNKEIEKAKLKADIDYFKETEKTRELNSFEKGIKEETERLLNQINS